MKYFLLFGALSIAGCSTTYNPARHEEYVSLAKGYHQSGEWKESIDTIDLIGKNSYLSDDLVILKARNLRQSGNQDNGLSELISESENRPHSEALILEIAQWYLDTDQNLKAKKILEKLYDMGNPSPITRKIYGYSLLLSEQWRKAESILNPLTNSNDLEAIFWCAQALYKLKEFDSAIPLFVKTYSSQEFDKRSAEYLAWIYTEQRNVSEANKYVRFLVLQNPEGSYAQKMLMRNLLNIPQTDKVTMLKLYNQKYEEEWSQYAYFNELKLAGMKAEAMDYLSAIWNQAPGTLWASTNYASEIFKSGNPELAKNVLIRSMKAATSDDAPFMERQMLSFSQPLSNTSRNVASLLQTYKVKEGDSLQQISEKIYKTSSNWKNIFEANRNILKNPESLSVGMILNIPEVNQ